MALSIKTALTASLVGTLLIASLTGCGKDAAKVAIEDGPAAMKALAKSLGRSEPEVKQLLTKSAPGEDLGTTAKSWLKDFGGVDPDDMTTVCSVVSKAIIYNGSQSTVDRSALTPEYEAALYRATVPLTATNVNLSTLNSKLFTAIVAQPDTKAQADQEVAVSLANVTDAVC
jgi:hypothetical protein